ncbi:hypothetical protein RhiJN_02607 [Ceratobasidium sp. AG-Ba]|nr:hypothetical protein RhiJN_02607 [Ceratobasidium sp. AG-Ba]
MARTKQSVRKAQERRGIATKVPRMSTNSLSNMAQAEDVPLWAEYGAEEGREIAASQEALSSAAKGRKKKPKKAETTATSRGRILLVRALNGFSFEQNGRPFTPTSPVRSWSNITLFGYAATLAAKTQNDFIATGYWDLKNHPVYNEFIKINPTHIYVNTIEGFAGGKPVICIESLNYVYATLHPAPHFEKAWWKFVKGFSYKGRPAPVWTDLCASDEQPDWWSDDYSFESCRKAISRAEQGLSDAPSESDYDDDEHEKGGRKEGQVQESEGEREGENHGMQGAGSQAIDRLAEELDQDEAIRQDLIAKVRKHGDCEGLDTMDTDELEVLWEEIDAKRKAASNEMFDHSANNKGKGREGEQREEREKEKETQGGKRIDVASPDTTEDGRGEGSGNTEGAEATRLPEANNPSSAETDSYQTHGASKIGAESGGNVGGSGSKDASSSSDCMVKGTLGPSTTPGGPQAAALDKTISSRGGDLGSLAQAMNLNQAGQKRPHEDENEGEDEGRKRPPPSEASQGDLSVVPSQVEMVRSLMPDIFTHDLSETTVALVEGPGVDGAETNSWLDGLFSFSRSGRAAAAGFTEWYIDQWPYKGWDNSALIGGARQLLLDEEVLLTTMDSIPMVGMMELFAGAVVMPDDARGYLQRRLVARISLLARDSVLKPPYMELWLHIMRVVRDWKESLSKDTGRDVSVPVFDRRLFDRSIDSSKNLPN